MATRPRARTCIFHKTLVSCYIYYIILLYGVSPLRLSVRLVQCKWFKRQVTYEWDSPAERCGLWTLTLRPRLVHEIIIWCDCLNFIIHVIFQVTSFSEGDVIRILDDIAAVGSLQKDHGGWVDDMALVRPTHPHTHTHTHTLKPTW